MTTAVNILATNFVNGSNLVTINPGAAAIVTITKPRVVDSGGLLLWDAWSAWLSDDQVLPVPPPVPGQTWDNLFYVYGNNGGSDILLYTAPTSSDLYLTIDDAYDAIAGEFPLIFTGYATYKIGGVIDPAPSGNRQGLSLLVAVIRPTSMQIVSFQ